MAVIVERTFTGIYGGSHRGIELRNEELLYPLYFGDNWTRLRIALLWSLASSANLAGGYVDVGVCTAGNRGVLGTPKPSNYVGSGYGGGGTRASAGTMGYYTTGGYSTATGPRHYYAQHGGTQDFYSQVNTGTAYTGGNSLLQNGLYYKRSYVVVDIERASSTVCNVGYHFAPAAQVFVDFGGRMLMDVCTGSPFLDSNAYVPGYNLSTAALDYSDTNLTSPVAVTWLESAGPLDALNVAWNHASVGLTIWGIAVAKWR